MTSELSVIRSLRRMLKWYLEGFRLPADSMTSILTADSRQELFGVLSEIDSMRVPARDNTFRRMRTVQKEKKQRVILPAGFRDNRDDDTLPDVEAEGDVSCG
mmetsp:Transcript_3944/g.11807  ORF Transcript_3944/g.11807 Transcript_3944/m.11807 type:complete len:102 (-) Transcript_3944:573-878(-)